MTTLFSDLKYAVRMLTKYRGFTLVVTLIIGLGVGANTAIFSALDQVALRSMPVKHPHELVNIQYLWRDHKGHWETDGITHYRAYAAYRDQAEVFADVIAFGYGDVKWRNDRGLQTIKNLGVSGNFFTMLGVRPALGRLFNEELEPDNQVHPTVVISYRFWQEHFNGQKDTLGKQLVLDDQVLTVIGVTPSGFQGSMVGWAPDVYIAAGTLAQLWDMDLHSTRGTWLYCMGRLKPGVTSEKAQMRLRLMAKNLKDAGINNIHEQLVINPGHHGWMAWEAVDLPRPLTLFLCVALFIMLIAAVNIANLQLSRAATRQKEIAIRQALGAGRWQIIRQLLTESLLLAFLGGVLGIVLAIGLDRGLCVLLGQLGTATLIPGLHPKVLLFALGIALSTGILFGLAPAYQVLRQNVTPILKESSNLVVLPVGRCNPHYILASLQIAMAVVVLTCAGLFVRSMIALNRIDPGYDTGKVIGVSIKHSWMLGNRPDLHQFYNTLHERVKDLPGVEASCLANLVPLGEAGAMRGVSHIDGIEIPKENRTSWWYGAVTPDYFKVLNMPLLKGRLLNEKDTLVAPPVMVINDIMAKTHWPNENPLGKVITYRGSPRQGEPSSFNVTIVGVVKATKMRSIVEGVRPIAYWPLAQIPRFAPSLLLRTKGNPKPYMKLLKQKIAALAPPEVCHVHTVAERVARLLAPQRTISQILNAFALAGLLLCTIGIYSVMAYGIKQRTREIGIRMALGAEKGHILKHILIKGSLVSSIGIGLGLGLSLIMIRLLEIVLPGLQRWDKFMLHSVDLWSPGFFIINCIAVLVITLLACYIPAQHAAKIDPMEALRYE